MIPIVMVPGLLCSAEVFSPQIPALWPLGPVTVASTLAGDSIAEIAARILADAPPRFALTGISLGGYIAQEIVRQAPERVRKLALISTSARPDTAEQKAQRAALLEMARAGDFEALLGQAMPMILAPGNRDNPLYRDTLVRMGLTVGLEGFARQTVAAIGRADSRPDLAAIGVPTLVLHGDADPLVPFECGQEIAAGIAGSTFVALPGCGHASTFEAAGAVNRALVEWAAG